MNARNLRLGTVFGAIAIGCLFATAIQASQDLKLPKAETVINTDINGNGSSIEWWLVILVVRF
ncbi:MAG: hypothetical protein HC778_04505 [Chamaesiphon sp. CSU_1_12]|nr:hypothetical protein [Chamaesiphon sp. CSU_1_12]